jgi:predicted RNA-binding Zn-ribbon protein involved in translation (DUF1610 family)
MPIVIWGSRVLTSTVESGTFYCPACDAEGQSYKLKRSRPFFTIYFIPLFPCGAAQRYVECEGCRGTFKEEVLEMGPPTEADRLMRQVYTDLQTGNSLEDAERRLTGMGLEPDQAREVVLQMTEEEDVWKCPDCGDHYVKAVRRCTRCRD